MNQKEKMIQRNNLARLLEHPCRMHRNCIQLKYKQSKEHFMAICEKAWELFQLEHEFITEAKLLNNEARGDLLDLDDKICYEKVCSENVNSLDKKDLIWKKHGVEMIIW